ncbi:MAG: hypothetical protein H0V44_02425, partial [Planctomycetes bacterium]|nr:hypothetical protein [Planctomycetota bacterium]
VNEPFRWHVRGDALGALLADTGWSLVELADHRALAGLLRRPAPLARGEILAWARRA